MIELLKILSMRFSLFLIFSVLFSISASAQEQELRISMKVSNVFTKEPVLDAKVDLLSEDSTLVATSSSNGSINGRKGAAMFILKKPGRYILHATRPDYEDAYESFEIAKFYKRNAHEDCPLCICNVNILSRGHWMNYSSWKML